MIFNYAIGFQSNFILKSNLLIRNEKGAEINVIRDLTKVFFLEKLFHEID